MTITLQTSVQELLLKWPEVRPALAEAGLTGLRHADHWPAPVITIAIAAQRHRLDAQALLAAAVQAIGNCPPTGTLTAADVAKFQHDCHCGEK